jgi:hypothetical protein
MNLFCQKYVIFKKVKLILIIMKKTLFSSLLLCFFILNPANAQVGKLLKNVKNSVKKELLGTPEKKTSAASTKPEPPCACDPADLIMEIGKYQIDYTELDISVLDDGSILVRDNASDNYYVAKGGVTDGPYKAGDPKIAQFRVEKEKGNREDEKEIPLRYKDYITKAGEKYIISFNGKNYGPYAVISKFILSNVKDKFVAVVTENVALTENQGKKMEEAMKNAKSDEERMQLAMQAGEQMQQNIGKGGSQSMMPKFVTNIPGVKVDQMTLMSGQFYSNLKYDDIVVLTGDKITDLQGNTIMTYSGSDCDPQSMFISSDNKKYACFRYGTLTFGDGKTLAELFNPHLVKTDGIIYLAYMYYSPKRNAIMQCRIPF